jgi:hypothetical protein
LRQLLAQHTPLGIIENRLELGLRQLRHLDHHKLKVVLTISHGGLGSLHDQVDELAALFVAQSQVIVQHGDHQFDLGSIPVQLFLEQSIVVFRELLMIEGIPESLVKDRILIQEPRLEIELEWQNLLIDFANPILVVLEKLKFPSFIFDAVNEPFEISPSSQFELSFLNLADFTNLADLFELQCQTRVEPLATDLSVPRVAKNPLVEGLVADDGPRPDLLLNVIVDILVLLRLGNSTGSNDDKHDRSQQQSE